MTKKILIAEDNAKYKELYRQWTQKCGFDVIEVSSVDEGLERICEVDAVITDHGLTKSDGNDLARIAKQHNLPVAGITAGDPNSFDPNLVDIPESKNITQENYGVLVGCLFDKDPRDSYRRKTKKSVNPELPAAANILLQGYYCVCAVQQGVDEIVSEGEVVVSRQDMEMIKRTNAPNANPNELFDMFKSGEIDPKEVYRVSCQNNPALIEDQRLKTIFDRLGDGDYDLSIDDAVYASRKII